MTETKNIKERIELLRAMELLARSVNDETDLMGWLMCGVADGDIDEDTTDDELIDYVEDDDSFAEIMGCFLRTMNRAKDGGLYCDRVVSK